MTRTPHPGRLSRAAAILVLAALAASCSISDQSAPGLTGPSGRGQRFIVTADSDQLPRDGTSQTTVTVLALDANGTPFQARVNLIQVGAPATLSATTVVTGAEDGKAFVLVTAPAPASIGNFIDVYAVPEGNNYNNNVTNYYGATDGNVRIRVLGPDNATAPEPEFTVTPAAPTETDTITFDASPTVDEGQQCGDACTYVWDFGDGSTATGRIVTHKYAGAGVFNVTLSVTDAAGTSASIVKQVVVADVPPPTVSFAASPAAPVAGQAATFTATATPAPNHSVTAYSWSWGDGTSDSSSYPTIVKTFTAAGSYSVTLTVTDDLGQTASVTQVIAVSSSLTADFTFSPTDPSTADTVFFDATPSKSASGNAIASYAWDFGDGNNGAGQTASHTYAAAATYVVRLTITDSQGNTGTVTKNVTVSTP